MSDDAQDQSSPEHDPSKPPVYHELQENPCWMIEVTADDNMKVIWHKGGRPNVLSKQLADTWVAHFKPHLFHVLPDGSFVGAGQHVDGKGIKDIQLIKDPDCGC